MASKIPKNAKVETLCKIEDNAIGFEMKSGLSVLFLESPPSCPSVCVLTLNNGNLMDSFNPFFSTLIMRILQNRLKKLLGDNVELRSQQQQVPYVRFQSGVEEFESALKIFSEVSFFLG
jgi:hypothetical protein